MKKNKWLWIKESIAGNASVHAELHAKPIDNAENAKNDKYGDNTPNHF